MVSKLKMIFPIAGTVQPAGKPGAVRFDRENRTVPAGLIGLIL